MKKIFPLLLLTLSVGTIHAQSSPKGQSKFDLPEICQELENAVVFVQYRAFKKDFITQNKDAAAALSTFDDYEALHQAYNHVRAQYNGLIGEIREDLNTFKNIKAMTKDPNEFAKKYLGMYNEVVQLYQNEYQPIYERVIANTKNAKVVPIIPVLISVGIDLFHKIVDAIKNRKEMKEEALNMVLGVVNQFFYNKMAMPSWTEIGIGPFVGATDAATVDPPTRPANYRDAATEPLDVSPAFTGDLNGYAEFIYLDANKQEARMEFTQKEAGTMTMKRLTMTDSKDIDVEEIIVPEAGDFISTQTFGEGTQFFLRVKNTAGMYVFSVNSGNDIKFLYPFKNEKLGNCAAGKTQMKMKGKDIDVDELLSTPMVGQDASGMTTLPSVNCENTPPTPRYFTIKGAVKSETFCVLFTRSEINIADLEARLESETTPLAERLTKELGGNLISVKDAGASMSGNKFTFDATQAQHDVMPVIFTIKR